MGTSDMVVIETFDGYNINDGMNYKAWFPADGGTWGLVPKSPSLVRRPLDYPKVSGFEGAASPFQMRVEILDTENRVALRDQLLMWLDVEEPKQLIIKDGDGGRRRYRMVLPIQISPINIRLSDTFAVQFQVHGDVCWRSVTVNQDYSELTASGQKITPVVEGDAPAYPIITMTPGTANSSGWAYKQWIAVRWRVELGYLGYPFELTDGSGLDTAALVTAAKAQADGDDFRVLVDGIDVPRWWGESLWDWNSVATRIWVNLDWEPDVPMTLKTAIVGTGDIESLDVNESIVGMAEEGIVMIGTEAFTYGSKNDDLKSFFDITRGVRNTTKASHSVDAPVYWIQHDIYYLYGNPAATDPGYDDHPTEPMLTRDDSNNGYWVFDNFGETGNGQRTLTWQKGPKYGFANYYTVDVYGEWARIGAMLTWIYSYARWQLYNPVGFTTFDIQTNTGKKYCDWFQCWGNLYMVSSVDGDEWTQEYETPIPTVEQTWQYWNRTETLEADSRYIGLYLVSDPMFYPGYMKMELEQCKLTLNSSTKPTVLYTGSEISNYVFAMIIENETTGDRLSLELNCEIDETIEIDTDGKTVLRTDDGQRFFSAIGWVGRIPRHWLPLVKGSNSIKFTDGGMCNSLEVWIDYEDRWR